MSYVNPTVKFNPSDSADRSIRPVVALGAFAAVTLTILICVVFQLVVQSHSKQTVAADPIASAKIGQHATVQASVPTARAVAPATPAPPKAVTQTCFPASNDPVAPLAITTADGFKQQVDSPVLYKVYGDTPTTLRSQIARCAPKTAGESEAEYVANTAYQVNWRYEYTNSSGTCQLSQVSVGIHIVQNMPSWQPATTAQSGLANKWNVFMEDLSTHENGHVNLDIQYAQQLMNDLRNFPPTSCGQIQQAVKQITDTDMSELAQANDNYDATTNHGATQGAILP